MDAQETKIFTAVLIACFIVAFIIIYFIISLVRQHRRNLQLSRQNLLTEISTLEKDRARMAADLHDELGPLLSQIKFRVNSLDLTDVEDEKQRTLSSQQIDEVIERVRGIARNLTPGSVSRKGLKGALEDTASNLNQNSPLHVSVQYNSELPLDEEKSINLYRVLQEICQNTIKHANATQLLIRIYDKPGTVCILCEDNGSGFDFQQTLAENKGLGLRNLKSRIEIMNGKFKVISRKNTGTQYLFEIPVKS